MTRAIDCASRAKTLVMVVVVTAGLWILVLTNKREAGRILRRRTP